MRKLTTCNMSAPNLFGNAFRLLVAIFLFFPVTKIVAADLIVERLDSARLTALPHSRVAWATAENDLGEVAGDLHLSHLTLVLKRSAEQQRAFEELLDQQQDPNSPNFHHWLTPAEIGERFGASPSDIDTLTSWLQSRGLQVDAVSNSRFRIEFSGTAASVGAAFASRMHAYVVDGRRRIAPAGAPMIPAALSPIIGAVHGLVTVDERPYDRSESARWSDRPSLALNPEGTSGNAHYIFPADFATIYNLNPVYQQGIDGTGRTIAIIGRARVHFPDIENFQIKSGLPIKDPTIIVPPGGIDPGPALSSGGTSPADDDQREATLDVTRAGSVAPGATILLVISAKTDTSSGLSVASHYVVDNRLAEIMSLSYGACEANAGLAGVAFWDSVFSQAAAEGISVFVSSGDSGAAGCVPHSAAPPAVQIASPNYICASSFATCVGGTQFSDTSNPTAYWRTSNGVGFESAIGYIPEGAWNEPLDGSGNPQMAVTGGGVSGYIPTPKWQIGPGVPGGQGRYTPDVSFSASAHDGYFKCFAARGLSCVSDATGHFTFSVSSGTSASAPSMAGIAALLNQRTGGAQGNLNPRLYALAAAPGNGVFHDVTVSTSGLAGCNLSTPSTCNNSTPGPSGLTGGLAGYSVGPGYDLATGLGSIDVTNLLAQWGGPSLSANFQGLWWKSPAGSESGWGINFAHQADTIFATWFTYNLSGYGSWLVMTAAKTGPTTYTGTLYATTGPPFGSAPFNPATVVATPVGTGTLNFSDSSNGTFAYAIGSTSQVKTITREQFGTLPTCTYGAQTDLALATNYTDLWWATPPASESGWGINFTHEGDTIFASWFTYDLGGTAMWLVFTAPKTAPGLYSGTIYQTKGPPFNSVPFDPNMVVSVAVGTANVSFTNGNSATFSYSVDTANGVVTQSKQLVREVFQSPGTTCQ